jgi:hypothetical protein
MACLGHRSRISLLLAGCCALASSACTDSSPTAAPPTAPPQSPPSASASISATAVSRLALVTDTGVVRIGPFRGPAAMDLVSGGEWKLTGALVADSSAANGRRASLVSFLSPSMTHPRRTPRSSRAGATASSTGPGAMRMRSLGNAGGRALAVLFIARKNAAKGEPARVSILLADGMPTMAVESEYRRAAGRWVATTEIISRFDPTGRQTSSLRLDLRHPAMTAGAIPGREKQLGLPRIGARIPQPGSSDPFLSIVRTAENHLASLLTPESLFAADAGDDPCISHWHEYLALQAAVIAAIADGDRARSEAVPFAERCAVACLVEEELCAEDPDCKEAAALGTRAAIAYGVAIATEIYADDVYKEYIKCIHDHHCRSGARIGEDDPTRSRQLLGARSIAVASISLGHLSFNGGWVPETISFAGTGLR